MSTRKETERVKLIQDKCQTMLTQMLRDEDNKYCVDCDAKGPRWASFNLGVFLCIRCAGIHRNLGVHISRVKSVNLDSWTPEQVVSLQQMGNSRARAVYEAQLPDGFRRPQTDSALESFIRAKYEHKKYLAREWVPPSPVKVDWDKEIDEEIEKQKRKKKATQSGTGLHIVPPVERDYKSSSIKAPLPAPLPKPRSSNSPKTNRTAEASHASSDLLGLSSPTNATGPSGKSVNDLQSDSFSAFLSAPPSSGESLTTAVNGTTTQGETKTNDRQDNGLSSLAKEEADFFNQATISSTSEKDKGKLTKDSILALYGTATTNSLGQFNSSPLVGFNSTFSHHQPTVGGGFMPMAVSSQQQTFPALVPGTGISTQHQTPFGQLGTNLAMNLNMNLAGMPPGLLGPPQPHPQTQFMTPPNSATMYNAPVMTAPGAFTSATIPPQVGGPQANFAQFPQQMYSAMPSVYGSSPLASANTRPVGSIQVPIATTSAMPATVGSGASIGGGGGLTGLGGMGGVRPPASSNLSQQFGNLNLGNVWQ